MFFGSRFCILKISENTTDSLVDLLYNSKYHLKLFLLTYRNTYSVLKDKNSVTHIVKIPHWIENTVQKPKIKEEKELLNEKESQILKKIRPFKLNQLSVFNPNPYSLSKPITKNPVLKHLWKLRVHSTYRQESSKRLVLNSNIIKHILLHTKAIFDNILTTKKDLIDFILSNPIYNKRYSRIQLVDNYTLQYCLRGTTQSYNTADTIAEAYVPEENKELLPKFVVAFDNIKYTQNLGSLIRTSLAFNIDLLYYLKGTTDPFNWKITSITGGLQYSIPYRFGELSDLRKFCKKNDLVPIVAHLEGEPLESVKISGKGICLILGNESEGPNQEIFKFAKRVSLYMHPFTNSLNVSVAGAIIIHQLKSILYKETE